MPLVEGLPKRERAILEILFRLGEATAREVQAALNDDTSYSAVRTFLSTLETKGRVAHRLDGQRYLWFPAGESEREGSSAIAGVVNTFFKGSRERAIAALLGSTDRALDEAEYERLLELIKQARARKE